VQAQERTALVVCKMEWTELHMSLALHRMLSLEVRMTQALELRTTQVLALHTTWLVQQHTTQVLVLHTALELHTFAERNSSVPRMQQEPW